MKVRLIQESTFENGNWTHGSQVPIYDYLLKVLDTLCSMQPIKLGPSGTDGVITLDNFTEEGQIQITELRDQLKQYVEDYKSGEDLSRYNLPMEPAWLDQFIDINSDLPKIITDRLESKRKLPSIIWTSIYKQYFTGRDPSLDKKEKKSNKGLDFEDNYLAALYNDPNEQQRLQDAINPGESTQLFFPINQKKESMFKSGVTTGFLGGPVKTGGECNKRPLTIAGDGFLYFFPSKYMENDIFNIGPTVTDITVPVYDNGNEAFKSLESKPMDVDSNADSYLYLSLKSTSRHTFVNGGVRPILPPNVIMEYGKREDIFNETLDINKTRYKDPINNKIKFDDPRAEYLFDMLCINKVKFIDTFCHYDQRASIKAKAYAKKTKSAMPKPYTEEKFDNTTNGYLNDKEKQEQIRRFVMSTIGYGYVLIDETSGKNKRIHYFDLRKKTSLPKFLAGVDSDELPDINSIIVSYPAYHQAKAITIRLFYPYVTLEYEFRSKDANEVYPTEITCNYKIKGIS